MQMKQMTKEVLMTGRNKFIMRPRVKKMTRFIEE